VLSESLETCTLSIVQNSFRERREERGERREEKEREVDGNERKNKNGKGKKIIIGFDRYY
jgi:hypothetical protein